jgi:hypothetical protein
MFNVSFRWEEIRDNWQAVVESYEFGAHKMTPFRGIKTCLRVGRSITYVDNTTQLQHRALIHVSTEESDVQHV